MTLRGHAGVQCRDSSRMWRCQGLPIYPPDINSGENWWDHERKNLLNNLYLKTNRRLEVAVRRFVKNVSTDTVKSVHNISAIEHLLKYPYHF